MIPPDARTLSGEVASPQHLVELRLTADDRVLPPPASATPEHLLFLGVRGRVVCAHAGETWLVDAHRFAWLAPIAPVTLRASEARPVELLVWRFNPAALPAAIHPLLPPPAAAPAHGPAPLTPSMQTLLFALRGCPVAPALRNLWGTGKLIELLTLILPPPADIPAAPPAARVLHPALRAAIDFMTGHLADPVGLPEIAAAAHSSPSHLSRLFTAEFGHGPTLHLRRLRLDHAADLLRAGRANVTEAAFAAGYQSLGQFSRAFATHHGRPPSTFLRK